MSEAKEALKKILATAILAIPDSQPLQARCVHCDQTGLIQYSARDGHYFVVGLRHGKECPVWLAQRAVLDERCEDWQAYCAQEGL